MSGIFDSDLESSVLISEYDYDLPPELIAQTPVEPRDASRLLVLDRARGTLEHRHFRDVVDYLSDRDLLVVNDSRVLPARLHGRRPSGGQVEILLLRRVGNGLWRALLRPGRRLRVGSQIILNDTVGAPTNLIAEVADRLNDGQAMVRLPQDVEEHLDKYGEMPLPPYIHQRLTDPERYQTIYADVAGSAAAPTAGLHFTPELMARLEREGVRIARVTLHVGVGTFLPVKVDDVRKHHMHEEWFHVPVETIHAIRDTRKRGGHVIAVGTTSCRTLESIELDAEQPNGSADWTSLFIRPGHEFQNVDGLITNFHLPKSTLMLLVSAFAGRSQILHAYREAIDQRYRFFSFGDAMLIL